jgi:hypothetical protein
MFKTIKVNAHFKVYGVRSLGLPEVLLCSYVFSLILPLNPSKNLSNASRRLSLVRRSA